MARRGSLLFVLGFNLVLTLDRYAFAIHLPISKWRPYLKNNIFWENGKIWTKFIKGMENVKSTWKSQRNFLSEKVEPCPRVIQGFLPCFLLCYLTLKQN